MKSKKTPISLRRLSAVVLVAFLIGVAIPLLLSNKSMEVDCGDRQPESGCCYTTSPEVPAYAVFADDTITLDRYDLRERMDRELMAFTYMHSTTMLIIKRANRYFPVIEPLLRENDIPDDFKYLAVIESNLSPTAKSPAGAAGLWQFMTATGREYGLEVNDNIDERYHIEKETIAACKYLKAAYEKYGDWLTVAASYNAGQQRISSELVKQHAERATDLYLVEETSRYMFRLLAAKAVIGNPKQFGFQLHAEQLYPPLSYEEVTVNRGIDNLSNFAQQHGISFAQLKEANLWLRQTSLMNRSGRTYRLKIPTRESMYYDPKATKVHNMDWVGADRSEK